MNEQNIYKAFKQRVIIGLMIAAIIGIYELIKYIIK